MDGCQYALKYWTCPFWAEAPLCLINMKFSPYVPVFCFAFLALLCSKREPLGSSTIATGSLSIQPVESSFVGADYTSLCRGLGLDGLFQHFTLLIPFFKVYFHAKRG